MMDPILSGALFLSVLIAAASTLWYKKTSQKNGGKTLPGPRGVPILGYLPFMHGNVLQHFTDLSHKYGPIYKLRLGSKLVVVISSPSLVKEVVRDHDSVFAHRDATEAALIYTRGGNGLVFSPPNASWRVMRKTLIRETQSSAALDASCQLRKEQLAKAVRSVYSRIGRPVAFGELVFQTEVNLVTNLIWGGITSDSEEDRERLGTEFRASNKKLSDLLGKPNVSDLFPILSKLDLQGVKRKTQKAVEVLDQILEQYISGHEKSLSGNLKNDGRKDFLQIMLELKEKNDADSPALSRDQLKALLSEVISGGSDTSATTVEFAMAELLNSPTALAKVQKELDEVVGKNNMVQEFHLPKLSFLNAVINETLRLHPPIPLLIPRSPSQTSTIGGYMIPKGSRILLNVWAIHRDPSIWYDPTEFKPERFLEDSRKLDFKGNNFEFIPFGSGRRICPGMPLAERMVAYLLATLLHAFEWKLVDGKKLDMSENLGIVLQKAISSVAVPTPRLSDINLYI